MSQYQQRDLLTNDQALDATIGTYPDGWQRLGDANAFRGLVTDPNSRVWNIGKSSLWSLVDDDLDELCEAYRERSQQGWNDMTYMVNTKNNNEQLLVLLLVGQLDDRAAAAGSSSVLWTYY
jgi:hypothetical protein